MGLPQIDIDFKSLAKSAIQRGERGTVALILKDTLGVLKNSIKITSIDKIPKTLKEDNVEQIKLALRGGYKATKEVLVFIIEENIEDAFKLLLNFKWDYLAIPDIDKVDDIATWIKSVRKNKYKKVKAVLPNCKADHEAIINFTSDEIKVKEKTYTTAQYCSRIAGILATTPLNISATYFVLTEVENIKIIEDPNKAVNDGELILINDGEKIKIGRAVNSLTSIIEGKTNDWKKIKIIDTMDLIYTDIRKVFQNEYVGKVPNDYDHKCIFITSVMAYFKGLEMETILNKGGSSVSLNIEKQKLFIEGQGIKTEKFSLQEIKDWNTGSKVFLKGKLSILDAMEDLDFNVEV